MRTPPADLATAVARNLLFGREDAIPLEHRVHDVVAALERNRVPVAGLPPSAQLDALAATAAGAEHLERHRERRDRVVEAFDRVARAWAEDGIPFVLVKSTGRFPYTSDNVDVLVPARFTGVARRRLELLGFCELAHLREPFKDYFALLSGRAAGTDVHLHSEVAWISRFVPGDEVAARRKTGDEAWAAFPSATHSLLIVTGHWFYEDKELKLRDVWAMASALRRGIDWGEAWATARAFGWERGFRLGLELYDEAVRSYGFDAPLANVESRGFGPRTVAATDGFPVRFSRVRGKALHYLKTWEDRSLSPREKAAETASLTRFAIQVKTPAGPLVDSLVVSCSGPDGSGKTTTAKATIERLESFGLQGHYHWMRVGDSRFLELLKAAGRPLLGGRESDAGSATASRGGDELKAVLSRHDRLRTLWGWVLAGDFLVRVWGKTARARWQGGVHLFDRHAVDAAVELQAVYGFGRAATVAAGAPRPDLRVLLRARPAELAARGDSPLAPQALESFLTVYTDPRWGFDHELETSSSVEEVAEELARLALRRMSEKSGS